MPLFSCFQRLLTAVALGVALLACKSPTDVPAPVEPMPGGGAVKPIGTPRGAKLTKAIGPTGGSLASADGAIMITVPAGALTALTEVGIEPITSTCPGSFGVGWRLTPHGNAFAKPVQLTIDYTAQQDSVSLPDALGLAYQDGEGVWQFVGAKAVDKAQHKLTMTTTHFSDWSFLAWMSLSPNQASVREGGQVTIDAFSYVPQALSRDGLVVPLVPTYENGYPVGESEFIDAKLVKKWSLAGVGTLNPLSVSPSAVYLAPNKVLKTQHVTVSLELNTKSGQAILVSNVTVLGQETAIDYLQVAEKTGPNGRDSELIIYGRNFGAQDKAKSSITINGQAITSADIGLWGDNIIVCRIPMLGEGASGPVQVKTAAGVVSPARVLNEWTVAMRYRRPCARQGQSLYEASTVYLRIRGDAGAPPADLKLIYDEKVANTVALKSYVRWEAGGSGSSVLNNEEACGTENEVWTDSRGDIDLTPNGVITDKQYFKASLFQVPGKGFEVFFTYHANDVVPSRYTFTNCEGYTTTSNRPYSVHLPSEFHEERLALLFNGNTLKAGKSLPHEVGIASMNLHCDFSDVPNWKQTVQVVWDNTPGKF